MKGQSKTRTLATGVSKAYWCGPDEGVWRFKPAYMPTISGEDANTKQISWLDVLLEGGLVLPSWSLVEGDDHRALTMLVSGPPGVGKSTFVFELVYRLSHSASDGGPWHVLYVSTETSAAGLQHQAIEHGWFRRDENGFLRDQKEWEKKIKQTIHPYTQVHGSVDRPGKHIDVYEESQGFAGYLDGSGTPVSRSGKLLAGLIHLVTGKRVEKLTEELDAVARKRKATGPVQEVKPDILVVDSLNTVGQDERGELFAKFLHVRRLAPKLIVMVLDTEDIRGRSGFWAYACDIVVHLDKVYPEGYMVRTLEVVKARYQPHIWGVHQLKIDGAHPVKPASDAKEITKLKRAHPYREEGGIFIYPSIHFVLSKYKRLSHAEKPDPVPIVPHQLGEMLTKGLPKWRCTGFVGMRGGHKSHLGYLNCLSRLIEEKDKKKTTRAKIKRKTRRRNRGKEQKDKQRALVVSLRDDEGMARQTMQGILDNELGGGITLEELEADDRLEILYYPPGYITPEEFFHRMMLSVHRLKHASQASQVTVLFNSLDQLSSRFPLCSNERIFVPGIIEALCAEQVTSIFIGVEEPGQPPEQYGLLSMADLTLSFNRCRFECHDYVVHVWGRRAPEDEGGLKEWETRVEKERGKTIDCVVVRVQRFAGGQKAGAGGILELVDAKDPLKELYGTAGLFFAELSPRASQGTLVDSAGVPR